MSSSVPPWRSTAPAAMSSAFPSAGKKNNFTRVSVSCEETNNLLAAPAYTPVQARRSLAHHTTPTNGTVPRQPTQSASPDTEGRARVEFPPPVRSYVQRCFAPENQVASVSIPEMQEKLRHVITEAAQNNKLGLIDWERLPLPQTMVQNERNKILANPSSSNWASSHPASPGDATRKRKSTDGHHSETGSPPWRKANRNRFEDRVTHPGPFAKQAEDEHCPGWEQRSIGNSSSPMFGIARQRGLDPRRQHASAILQEKRESSRCPLLPQNASSSSPN